MSKKLYEVSEYEASDGDTTLGCFLASIIIWEGLKFAWPYIWHWITN